MKPLRRFRPPAWPGLWRLAAALACGALAAAGQAPLSAWYLALPAYAGLAALILRETAGARMFWLGWTAGVGHFAVALFWIVEPFMVDAARDGWMAPFALVFLSAGMALFWGLAAAVAALGGRNRAARGIGLALGLAGSDLLRSYVLTGFPWALAGHIWIDTPVMQVAAWTGPIGLSLLTGVAAVLPALSLRPRRMAGLTVLSVATVAAFWMGGHERLLRAPAPRESAINVRLVQPNATQSEKWRPEMWDIFMRRQLDLTAEPKATALDLVVWPETAIPWLLEDSGALFSDVTALSGGVPLAVGAQRSEGARYFNSLAFTDGAGKVTDVYDKWHLVPFGEYLPMGDFLARFGITAFAAQSGGGYSAGPGPLLVDLGRAGKILPLICYEAIFPQDLRTADRPDWILQVTNDGWFGALAGPYQHLAQARLRAVEQGLPLLRAANTGVSAVIDAQGRILQSLPLNTMGRIDAAVPPALARPLYARTGDWPATVLIVAGLLLLGLSGRRTNAIDRPISQV